MDWIRWISMTMSERILIMVKNKVVLKERDPIPEGIAQTLL